jgi:cyclic beta-1,2-glucan synthetase
LFRQVEASDTPRWDDPIAVGLVDVALAPGQSRTLVHVIGAGSDQAQLVHSIGGWNETTARESLTRTEEYWQTRCSLNPMETDDPVTDLMVNGWLPYQAIAGRIYAKCAYYQQGGAYGYRDQLQDSLMFLQSEPDLTLLQLKRHAEAMFEDGGVRHWWHPETDIAVKSRHSDTCLWLAFGTLEYLDATGDLSSLDTVLSYLPGGVVPCGYAKSPDIDLPAPQNGEGTLLDHCLRGIERVLALRSPRGIPLMRAIGTTGFLMLGSMERASRCGWGCSCSISSSA